MKKTLVCLHALALLTAYAAAQEQPYYVTGENATGTTPFGSYAGLRENVDLNNLNLNIAIPLFTLRGRAGFDVAVGAYYNAIQKEWVLHTTQLGVEFYTLDNVVNGVPEVVDLEIAPRLQYIPGAFQQAGNLMYQNRYVLRLPDGSRTEFVNKDTDGNVNSTVQAGLERFRSFDGSFMELRELVNTSTVDIILKDGTTMRFQGTTTTLQAQWMRDANGNLISYTGAGSVPTTLTDTLGRTVVRNAFTDVNGDYVVTVTVKNGDGSDQVYTLRRNSAQTQQTLSLPNGLQYVFDFTDLTFTLQSPIGANWTSSHKKLTRITYPAGGYTRYLWNRSVDLSKVVLTDKYLNDTFGEDHTVYSESLVPAYKQVTLPSGDFSRHYFTQTFFPPTKLKIKSEFYGPTLKKSILTDWSTTFGDPREIRETTILHDVTPNLYRKSEMDYDDDGYTRAGGKTTNGNVEALREYDWGNSAPGALLRRTARTYLNTLNYNIDNKHILNRMNQEIVYDGASVRKAQTDLYYDEYTSPWTLISATGAVQRDSAYGTSYTTRGNLSRLVDWLNTGTSPVANLRYDIFGNIRESRNPNLFTTATTYSSATQFAYPDRVTDPKGFITDYTYDFSNTSKRGFGYLLSQKDVSNGNLITSFGYDVMGRLKSIDYPDGGQVRHYYSDLDRTASHRGSPVFLQPAATLPLRRKTFTLMKLSPLLEKSEISVHDGLGRLLSAGTSNGGQYDWVRTEYDANSRLLRTSNPVTLAASVEVPAAGSFTKWTTNSYDYLSRIVLVQTPDGQTAPTSYLGNLTTVGDQLGNQRQLSTDGLGRLAKVREPDAGTGSLTSGYNETFYTHDPLDNLTGVSEGSQSRSFVYDSLSRLSSETHPESGQTTYAYDANGNLTRRTDARSVQTNYNNYDGLDRPGSITYSDPSTSSIGFVYDGAGVPNGKGRLTGRSDGVGSESFAYDSMGRVSSYSRGYGTLSQTANYVYDLAGGLSQEAYPGIYDGTQPLTVYRVRDDSGREAQTRWSNGSTAIQDLVDGYSMTYSGSSATEIFDYANGTLEVLTYNDRLQPTGRVATRGTTTLMNFSYSFQRTGDNKNNGNVFTINDLVVSGRNRTFTYDYLNRLKTAAGGGTWSHTYIYDRYGNLNTRSATGSGLGLALTVSPTTNRITSSGYSYDVAGNLTAQPGATYQYDAESRMKSMGTTIGVYSYDAEGRRIKKAAGGETRYYFYAPGEVDPTWVYKVGTGWETYNHRFQGRLAATNSATISPPLQWIYSDHLGSPSVKADSAGTVRSRDWYYPFGEPWMPSNDGFRFAYTAKERDAESDLLYFGARCDDSYLARFLTVDPLRDSATPDNPQSWNRYSYTVNNPLLFVDPTGELLRFTGTPEQMRALERIADNGLFGKRLKIDDRGNATLAPNGDQGPETPEQSAFAEILAQSINDPVEITIGLTNGSSFIAGEFGRQQIDLSDIEAFGNGEGMNQAGSLAHEIAEQAAKQAQGVRDEFKAHDIALAAERRVTGFSRGARPDSRTPLRNGVYDVVIIAKKDGKTVKITLTIKGGNIIKVTRS